MAVSTSNTFFGKELENNAGNQAGMAAWNASPLGILFGGQGKQINYTPEDINVDWGKAGIQGADQYRGAMWGNMNSAQGRAAPTAQAAQIATGAQDQTRMGQLDLANALASAGQRGGPSVVNEQMAQALAQQNAAATSRAKSMRGVNPALANAMAQQQMAQNQGQVLAQANVGRLQERQQDQQNLLSALQGAGSMYGQARGMDQSIAGQQAGFAQQAGLANQSAALQQSGMNDAYQQNMLNSALQMEGQIQQGNVTLEQARLQGEAQERANALQAEIANMQSEGEGGILGFVRDL